jgi:hypothetical protein
MDGGDQSETLGKSSEPVRPINTSGFLGEVVGRIYHDYLKAKDA